MAVELQLADELLDTAGPTEAADRCVEVLRRRLDRPMFGVYLLESERRRPTHAATWNVSDAFTTEYERAGRQIDPVLSTAVRQRSVAYNLALMPINRWRETEIYRRAAYLERFDHVVIAPVVSGGRVTATVHAGDDGYGRPFGRAELQEVASISRVLSVVLREHRRRAGDRASGAVVPGPIVEGARSLDRLTPRELQVASLVIDELTDAEIGRTLHVSPHTVRQHLKNIYRKLEVRSRVGLTRRCLGCAAATVGAPPAGTLTSAFGGDNR